MFEYKIEVIKYGRYEEVQNLIEPKLNLLGEEGWELVSFQVMSSIFMVYVFKRKK